MKNEDCQNIYIYIYDGNAEINHYYCIVNYYYYFKYDRIDREVFCAKLSALVTIYTRKNTQPVQG